MQNKHSIDLRDVNVVYKFWFPITFVYGFIKNPTAQIKIIRTFSKYQYIIELERVAHYVMIFNLTMESFLQQIRQNYDNSRITVNNSE